MTDPWWLAALGLAAVGAGVLAGLDLALRAERRRVGACLQGVDELRAAVAPFGKVDGHEVPDPASLDSLRAELQP